MTFVEYIGIETSLGIGVIENSSLLRTKPVSEMYDHPNISETCFGEKVSGPNLRRNAYAVT